MPLISVSSTLQTTQSCDVSPIWTRALVLPNAWRLLGTTVPSSTLFVTTTPLRGYHVTSTDAAQRVDTDVRYQAFTDPFEFSLDIEGAAVGAGHYESIGRASGTIRVDGRIDVRPALAVRRILVGHHHLAGRPHHGVAVVAVTGAGNVLRRGEAPELA